MPDDFDNSPPSFSAARKFGTGFNVLVGIAAFLAIVVMANFLAARHYRRLSLSEDRVPPLAPVTLQVLAALTNTLNVTVFFDPDEALYTHILQLLKQYEIASPHVRVSVVNYITEPAKAEQIKAAAKLGPNVKEVIIFEMNGRHRVVRQGELSEYDTRDLLAGKSQTVKRKSFTGESYFTSAILTLIESRPLNAYYLVGHKEHDPETASTPAGYGKLILLLRDNNMGASLLPLTGTNEVPADCSLLVVAGPLTPVHPNEIEKLNRYLNRGGRALFLLPVGSNHGLEEFLGQWGVELRDDVVRDAAGDRTDSHLTLKIFGDHEIVRPFGITQNGLILPRARSITPRPGGQGQGSDAPQVRVLVSTSEIGESIADYRPGARFDPRRDRRGAIPVAVAIERGGLRSVEGGSTRMVVVGDSDFLDNRVIDHSINRDFVGNAINWLVDRPRLVGIAPQPMRELIFSMTDSQARSMRLILLAAVPGGILAFGLLVWFRRQS